MKSYLIIFTCLIFGGNIIAQNTGEKPDFEAETMAFLKVLNAGDSTGIRSFFFEDAQVFHVEEGVYEGMSIESFMTVAESFASGKYQEEFIEIKVTDYENGLVYTDVTFHFFVDGELTHIGVDHCMWLNKGEGYKIERLYSSWFVPKVQINPEVNDNLVDLNLMLDGWHENASKTKFEAYFGFMAEDFIFLGTDPSERWTKVEFAAYCKPYFDAGKAWTFTRNWRNIYYNADNTVAWFEESLDTQMDECRGSGVLKLVDGEWKIAHYNLTVLIENEKMKKFLKLRSKKK
ncbi:MAG: nuclear transport factor 2 family protein [Crocinitomicaceae bacterium]|nr:nuclear transport factor 2 family protein [Crocinitomicaceae bacterium]